MTDETANLLLEMLQRMRVDMDLMRSDIRDIKLRMTSLEESIAGLRGDIANLHTVAALHAGRMDRIEDRLARIERRLDLVDVH